MDTTDYATEPTILDNPSIWDLDYDIVIGGRATPIDGDVMARMTRNISAAAVAS